MWQDGSRKSEGGNDRTLSTIKWFLFVEYGKYPVLGEEVFCGEGFNKIGVAAMFFLKAVFNYDTAVSDMEFSDEARADKFSQTRMRKEF